MIRSELANGFVETINEHAAIIYKVCHLYMATKEEIEDLYQEIVYQLWRSFPKFRNESKVSTWIYRVALNTAITSLSKKKATHSPITLKELKISDENNSSRLYETKETVSKAVNCLSNNEKSIILLHIDGYKNEEIAEIVGISLNNTAVKINRIKEKLKSIINQQ